MKREPWQGKVLAVYEINCAECDASDMYRGPRGTRAEAIDQWLNGGWTLRTLGEFADRPMWHCPKHASAVER